MWCGLVEREVVVFGPFRVTLTDQSIFLYFGLFPDSDSDRAGINLSIAGTGKTENNVFLKFLNFF